MKTLTFVALSLFSMSAVALQCKTSDEVIECTDLNDAGAVICTLRGDTYVCDDFYPKLGPQPEPPPEEPDTDCWDFGECDE